MKHHITDILEKFEEGEHLYNTSATFNRCVHYLAAGGDIYQLLESIINMNEELHKRTIELLEKSSVPITVRYDNSL